METKTWTKYSTRGRASATGNIKEYTVECIFQKNYHHIEPLKLKTSSAQNLWWLKGTMARDFWPSIFYMKGPESGAYRGCGLMEKKKRFSEISWHCSLHSSILVCVWVQKSNFSAEWTSCCSFFLVRRIGYAVIHVEEFIIHKAKEFIIQKAISHTIDLGPLT
jgi:hypothetical protein